MTISWKIDDSPLRPRRLHMWRLFLIAAILVLGAASFVCKQSSTAPEADIPPEQDISISCTPQSGESGTVFTVSITLGGIDKEITVFGMDLTFDANLFRFQGANRGDLTEEWAAVDANEIRAGTLRVGGFTGSGTPIPARSRGTIVEIRLKVEGGDFSDGQKSQICIGDYTDDIVGLTPMPTCTLFELRK